MVAIKSILVFGSEDIPCDKGAVAIGGAVGRSLPEVEVRRLSRPEQVMDYIGKDFIILDVARGVDAPTLITDLDCIDYGSKVTAHDMDLASFLKTLKELGELDEVRVVAIPGNEGVEPESYLGEVLSILRGLL